MKTKPTAIQVSQPSLPPLAEFVTYLEKIWESRILTNGGAMHRELEVQLAGYLGVPQVSLFNNATNALMTSLQAFRLAGEVITTPYSFAATTHSIQWAGLTPVFVDIDPQTFNLDADRIEAAITERTTAIMPVHCYGYPCDVAAIEEIARRHDLRVIYDAAHAFGVRLYGRSVLNWGDAAVLSFHATKVFNTFEGGAVICQSADTKARIDRLKNFGIVDESTIQDAGLNGKMSEVNAAFGLLQLQHVGAAVERRLAIDAYYRQRLAGIAGIGVPGLKAGVEHNGAYFPIIVDRPYGLDRDALYSRLAEHEIFARRYFYPLLSDLPMYRHVPSAASENLPHATRLSRQVLCLPMHAGLTEMDLDRVVEVVQRGVT